MNALDAIFLVILIPFVVRGIKLGFMVQLAAVVAIAAGTFLAFRFSSLLADAIAPIIKASPKVLHIIAFTLILIVAIFVFHIVGKGLQKVVKMALLGWLDKLLGALFAILKVMLVLGILIMLFNTLNVKYHWVDEKVLSGSLFYNPLKDLAYTVFPYFKELLAK